MAALEPFKTIFPAALEARMRAKLGLLDARTQDRDLIEHILKLLAQDRVDYTIFWRRLSRHVAGDAVEPVRDLFLDRDAFDAWMLHYSERTMTIPRWDSANLMLKTNPKYVLRNHLGEQAIQAAKTQGFLRRRTPAGPAGAPF
jgi:uncharacterized protein YdiU (UPF0061 family)